MRSVLAHILGALLLAMLTAAPAQNIRVTAIDSRQVPLLDGISPGDYIGRMRFLGMLALPSLTVNGIRFAQLSDLAWDNDEGVLYAISDKGGLFSLRPVFSNEILTGIELLGSARLEERGSDKPARGRRTDAEGMDIRNGRNGRKGDAELMVSFERFPRIIGFRSDGQFLSEYPLPDALKDRTAYQSANRMLEAVCLDPVHGYITVPEVPLNNEPPNLTRLFSGSGKTWPYPVEANMRVASIECLGGHNVLILEREFGRIVGRTAITIKHTKLPLLPASGAPVHTEMLITMNSAKGFQIDNFEGMTRHRGNRYFLISDDNDLFIQRTLLLYVELPEH